MNPEALLDVRSLSAGYGAIPVLRDVSFQVGEGEIVGVLGHNGMGKTTLMKALVGHIPITGGGLLLGGVEVTHVPTHKRARLGMGYVSQGRDIFPSLTVRENLAIGAAALGHDRTAAVDQAVGEFPILGRLLDRKGGALSGGEQQILALARALCGQPRLLLLDEPTEGIQPSIVDEIEDYLVRRAKESSLAVVVVEQDVGFIAAMANRVLWLQKGTIVKEIDPALLSDPDTVAEFSGLEGKAD
ncbi:ABC transporter ATP-binding protein [Pusillimonas noertemannii]|uniref:Amino acid/amide ABC transporter ATP-binding protein 2 (HAAT family) n=1 Tax=Pusillimonas noertemannii TaxID=305977 RepID=A0A2U1CLG7_9BURK|nr:ABC transporter ATP-binding protein [Pusillimonas noertemannii]NYT69367.1 ABC transporter ATP-binding protein [Pusillimonas noertemannii]PVY61833.1 amino acid/amide ABC transporter ATP-binding protein 2 (HAAT family) [Pusillimonas noertemannii]TFL09761.1 ABC transporter ATP-binding protein [Pusillimonas noertemannii]